MTRHVALYCRLSPRQDGGYEGVDDQEKWGREYAARVWPVEPVEVYADTGISAANGDHRPDFERLRADVRGGNVGRVWVVEQSRLDRTEVGWFELAAELDGAGIDEVHTDRDGIVRVRDEVAGIKAVLNAAEVRKMKRRQADSLAAKAARGEPGGIRPYGYMHAKTDEGVRTYEIVEAEAAIIRECGDRVLSGWSLAAIVRDLQGRGMVGPQGGQVSKSSVRSMLTNYAVAGKRANVGKRGTRPGEPVRGNWPAILDESTWRQVRAKLDKPRTITYADGRVHPAGAKQSRAGRRYLLTGGLAFCGVCGAPLAGALKTERRKAGPYKRATLACRKAYGGRSCVLIAAEPVEEHVMGELWRQLDRPEFLAAVTGGDGGEERRAELIAKLDGIEEQRRELAGMWSRSELSTVEWQAARDGLDAAERQHRSDLAAVPAAPEVVDIAQARAAWPDMTLDERREFVRLFVAAVTISQARPGTSRFDPTRVAIEWRELR